MTGPMRPETDAADGATKRPRLEGSRFDPVRWIRSMRRRRKRFLARYGAEPRPGRPSLPSLCLLEWLSNSSSDLKSAPRRCQQIS